MRFDLSLLAASALALMVTAAPAELNQRELPPSSPSPVASVTASASPASYSPLAANSTANGGKRFVAYWSIFHARTELPTAEQLKGVTHLILSFVAVTGNAAAWVGEGATAQGWTVDQVKSIQAQGIKVGVAVGGWGYDNGFRPASKTPETRTAFATALISWCRTYGLDGVDLDWEYPVNNGANYLLPASDPMSRRLDDTDGPNFVLLAQEVRKQLTEYGTQVGKSPFMSIAVPSKPIDMVAYQVPATASGLDAVVDWWNLMSYDFINRRDTKTGHHAGATVVQETFAAFKGFNIAPAKLNIGFPMYAKWFSLDATCSDAPYVGCDLGLHENPANGTDLKNSGSVTYNAAVADNADRAAEFALIDQDAHSDSTHHASSFVGTSIEWGHIFWTWLSAADMEASCKANLPDAGGVMVWSINQDTGGAAGGPHFAALQKCLGVQ